MIDHQGALGPLAVSRSNPRYFTVDERKAVYLAGSHIWNNLHDGMGPGSECGAEQETFDYDRYLALLEERGHNFIRLWRWEHFKSQAASGEFHLCMNPQPWLRTGPGDAIDGKSKFNLDEFDPAFFDRLRERVVAAGERGMYAGVMFFEGWALHLSPAPDQVEGHPFYAVNNVNGIVIESIVDYQVLPLDARVQEVQEAYIRKVIDTLHDLPNVLWEVANESSGGGAVDASMAEMLQLPPTTEWGDSTQWQYWVIDVVKRHEEDKGYEPHPIGMTMQWPVPDQVKVNEPLVNSRAEWISPGYDDEIFADGGHPAAPGSPPSRWLTDPPPADGRKIVISDTDHYAPGQADVLWAWKSFLRGHHPILMDFGLIGGLTPSADPDGAFAAFEAARYAMGDTVRFAERVGLLDMEPRVDVASTGYALVNPGKQYVVLQPDASREPMSVHADAGTYHVEWFDIMERRTSVAENTSANGKAPLVIEPPFAPAVLFLESTTTSSR